MDDRFGLPVRYVLYSHSDADHASGGEVFADTAEFVGHENMRDGVPNGVHPPTTFYSDRHLVTLGGKSVEMIYPKTFDFGLLTFRPSTFGPSTFDFQTFDFQTDDETTRPVGFSS